MRVDCGVDSRTENISRRRSSSLFSAAVEKASTPTRATSRSLKELLGLPFEVMVLGANSTTGPNINTCELFVYFRNMLCGVGTHKKNHKVGRPSCMRGRNHMIPSSLDDLVLQHPIPCKVRSPHAYLVVIGTGGEPGPRHVHLHLPDCCRVLQRSQLCHPHIRQGPP